MVRSLVNHKPINYNRCHSEGHPSYSGLIRITNNASMMSSSNWNIFRVTGHLCGEFTGPRLIPRTKASEAELWYFIDLRPNIRLSKQSWGRWFETPSRPLWRHFVLKLAEVRQISTLIIHIMIRWHLYNKSAQLYEYASRLWNKFIGIQPYIRCLHQFNYLCLDTSYNFFGFIFTS